MSEREDEFTSMVWEDRIGALISDLEKSEDPSDEINIRIGCIVFGFASDEQIINVPIECADYTGSLDAICNLINSTFSTNCYSFSFNEELNMISNAQINFWPLGLAGIEKKGGAEIIGKGMHHHPARALCIALLKALQIKNRQQ